MPRPTRLRSLRADAGFRFERLSSSGIGLGYWSSTRTRWRTFLSIPATSGVSGRSTVRPILPRPRARSVPRLRSVWPIWLRTWVMRSFLFAIVRLLRRRDRSDGLLGRRLLLRGLRLLLGERQDVGDRLPARLRHLLRAAEALESLDGGLEHVDRVRRAEALREDVADAAAGDDAGSLARRTQQHPRGAVRAEDLVRDRRAVLRDREEVLLRVLDGLRDRERHLTRFAVADADPVDLVADHHERGEREPPAALDDFGDAVDLDHALLELASLLVVAQNSSPPSRAASASAFTRPW